MPRTPFLSVAVISSVVSSVVILNSIAAIDALFLDIVFVMLVALCLSIPKP